MYAVEALEEHLGVPAGELVEAALLGERETKLPERTEDSFKHRTLDEALDDLRTLFNDKQPLFTALTMMSEMKVSEDWTRAEVTETVLAKVHSGKAIETLVKYCGASSDEQEPLRVVRSEGMTLERQVNHPSGGLVGFLFRLDEPAAHDDLIHYSVTYDMPLGGPTYSQSPIVPLRELVLALEFHPNSTPKQVFEIESLDPDAVRTPISMNGRHRVVISRRHFGPATLGLRWNLEEGPQLARAPKRVDSEHSSSAAPKE